MNKKLLQTLAAAATLTVTMGSAMATEEKNVKVMPTAALARALQELVDKEKPRSSVDSIEGLLTPYSNAPEAWTATFPPHKNGMILGNLNKREGYTGPLRMTPETGGGYDKPLRVMIRLMDPRKQRHEKKAVWITCTNVLPITFKSLVGIPATLVIDGTINPDLDKLGESTCKVLQ